MSGRTFEDSQAINNFCEYLKIKSVHPNIDYSECVDFLKKQAKSLNLPIKIHYLVPKKPTVVLTWEGTNPTLPSILLSGHMDVVPDYESEWTYPPFAAHIDEKNNIYARGSQDMKCLSIQYLEAVRRLKGKGLNLKRTVHICFNPDEEIGSDDGMKKFVTTQEFKDLNVGLHLDEGIANPGEEFIVFYAERALFQLEIHCLGNPEHGSLLLDNTVGEKAAYILQKIYEFRQTQIEILKNNPELIVADVTTINLTKIEGGVQTNVIPPKIILTFDCRIPPSVNSQKWEETLNQWCKEAGEEVWIEFLKKEKLVSPTKIDNSNIFWVALKDAIDELGLKLKPQVCLSFSDARCSRQLGIPAFGFSPINFTPVLVHGNDEYLGVDTFLKGIEIYSHILTSVANKT